MVGNPYSCLHIICAEYKFRIFHLIVKICSQVSCHSSGFQIIVYHYMRAVPNFLLCDPGSYCPNPYDLANHIDIFKKVGKSDFFHLENPRKIGFPDFRNPHTVTIYGF